MVRDIFYEKGHDCYDDLPTKYKKFLSGISREVLKKRNCESLFEFARKYDLKPRKDDSDESHFDELDE